MGLWEEVKSTTTNLVLHSESISTSFLAFNALIDAQTWSRIDISRASSCLSSLHTTFMIQCQQLLSLTNQLSQQMQAQESTISGREKDAVGRAQLLEERERKCTLRECAIGQREVKIHKRETELHMEEVGSIVEIDNQLPTLINLNIGGTIFSLAKQNMILLQGSYLEQIILHGIQLNGSGEICLDRSPAHFAAMLSYYLYATPPVPVSICEYYAVDREFYFFKVPYSFQIDVFWPPQDSVVRQVEQWFPDKRYHLLYMATVDGFEAQHFHKLCDNKGPTLTIIRSVDGYLFGGYSPRSWESKNGYKTHPDSFIFTLTNPHNIPPTKYPLKKQNNHAIICVATFGPSFGRGSDITLRNNSNQSNNNCFLFPESYVDTTGYKELTFTGTKSFQTSEIQVYTVI